MPILDVRCYAVLNSGERVLPKIRKHKLIVPLPLRSPSSPRVPSPWYPLGPTPPWCRKDVRVQSHDSQERIFETCLVQKGGFVKAQGQGPWTESCPGDMKCGPLYAFKLGGDYRRVSLPGILETELLGP